MRHAAEPSGFTVTPINRASQADTFQLLAVRSVPGKIGRNGQLCSLACVPLKITQDQPSISAHLSACLSLSLTHSLEQENLPAGPRCGQVTLFCCVLTVILVWPAQVVKLL